VPRSAASRALNACLATAIIAPVVALAGAPAAQADGRAIVSDLARDNLGTTVCGKNSLGGTGYLSSCRTKHAWCADFATWVWKRAGLRTDELTSAAASFYLYGQRNGTLHTDPEYVPQVGDAVVFEYRDGWAEHVALVDSVEDGTMTTINGNSGGTVTTSTVAETTGPAVVGEVVAGQRISAFVSPVGRVRVSG
jgi:hypothetical protein